jgi:hypothetical protein
MVILKRVASPAAAVVAAYVQMVRVPEDVSLTAFEMKQTVVVIAWCLLLDGLQSQGESESDLRDTKPREVHTDDSGSCKAVIVARVVEHARPITRRLQYLANL